MPTSLGSPVQQASGAAQPQSPTTVVKPAEDNNTNNTVMSSATADKLMSQYSAMKKTASQGTKPKSVSFSERPDNVVEIPSVKYPCAVNGITVLYI